MIDWAQLAARRLLERDLHRRRRRRGVRRDPRLPGARSGDRQHHAVPRGRRARAALHERAARGGARQAGGGDEGGAPRHRGRATPRSTRARWSARTTCSTPRCAAPACCASATSPSCTRRLPRSAPACACAAGGSPSSPMPAVRHDRGGPRAGSRPEHRAARRGVARAPRRRIAAGVARRQPGVRAAGRRRHAVRRRGPHLPRRPRGGCAARDPGAARADRPRCDRGLGDRDRAEESQAGVHLLDGRHLGGGEPGALRRAPGAELHAAGDRRGCDRRHSAVRLEPAAAAAGAGAARAGLRAGSCARAGRDRRGAGRGAHLAESRGIEGNPRRVRHSDRAQPAGAHGGGGGDARLRGRLPGRDEDPVAGHRAQDRRRRRAPRPRRCARRARRVRPHADGRGARSGPTPTCRAC